jgi:hypothetical protein
MTDAYTLKFEMARRLGPAPSSCSTTPRSRSTNPNLSRASRFWFRSKGRRRPRASLSSAGSMVGPSRDIRVQHGDVLPGPLAPQP